MLRVAIFLFALVCANGFNVIPTRSFAVATKLLLVEIGLTLGRLGRNLGRFGGMIDDMSGDTFIAVFNRLACHYLSGYLVVDC